MEPDFPSFGNPNREPNISTFSKDAYWLTGIFFGSFAIYLYHLYPALTPRDGMEIATYVPRLLPLHQPGYPLYVLLAKAFSIAVPVGNAAYRLSLFSALCSTLALSVTFITTKAFLRIFNQPNAMNDYTASIFSLIGVLSVGMSPVIFSQAILSEVFPLNTLIFSFILNRLIHIIEAPYRRVQDVQAIAFLCGLGLAHHPTIVFVFPSVAFAIYSLKEKLSVSKQDVVWTIFWLICGFSVYLTLIPLFHWPWTSWKSWVDMFASLTRQNFGTLQLARTGVFKSSSEPFATAYLNWLFEMLAGLWRGLTPAAFILLLIGLIFPRTRRTFACAIALIALVGSGPIFLIFVGRLSPTSENIETISRFMGLPYITLPLFISAGALTAESFLPTRIRASILPAAAISLLMIPFIFANITAAGRRKCFIPEDFSENTWRSLTDNSRVLLGKNSSALAFQYSKLKSAFRESKEIRAFLFEVPSNVPSRDYWAQLARALATQQPAFASSSLVISMGIPPGLSITNRGLIVGIAPISGHRKDDPGPIEALYVFRGFSNPHYRADPFLNALVGSYVSAFALNAEAALNKGEFEVLKNNCRAILAFAHNDAARELAQHCLTSVAQGRPSHIIPE